MVKFISIFFIFSCSSIRQKFKINRIFKKFGQLSGEELFKPITKRLDKATKEPETAEEPAEERGPKYGMEEFDRLNPFYDDFRPDAETPPPTPPPSSTPSPSATALPEEEEEEDDFPPPPPEEKRKTWEEPAATSFLKSSSDSVDLQTVNRLIKQFDGDANYKVKSKKSKFYNYSLEDLKKNKRRDL